jgi:tetratricopeptide (TPR) repeat protein
MDLLPRLALALLGLLALATPVGAQDVRLVPPRLVVLATAGSPVELRSVSVSAEVYGALAITTVDLTFFNPNPRVLEGELQFPLLAGQSVIGFALDVDGRMRDAVPVDKARGQAIFEEITRAQVDPGLLQVTAGNNYKLRVYPIPASGTRRVSLRYVESLAPRAKGRMYRVPVEYGAGVREFLLQVRVESDATPVAAAGPLGAISFHRVDSGWRAAIKRSSSPRGIVEVAIPDSSRPRAVSQRFGEATYFHAEGRVRATQGSRSLPRVVQLVWDSSGSMAARDFARESALLDAYFAAARSIEVRLVKVRDVAEPGARFRVTNGDWSALRRALADTPYDGATNLAAVPPDPDAQEVLLFSDGLANFGDGAFRAGSLPVFAVSSTASAADLALRHLAEASGGRHIDLLADTAPAARDKLLRNAARISLLEGEGVRDLVAATPVLADGRFAIAGLLVAPRGALRATITHADGKREVITIPVAAAASDGRLAATTWASWKLAALESDPDLNRGEIRRLGRAFGIATRETSLIVLERVEDYVRHEVAPPPELADAYAQARVRVASRRDADRYSHVERVVKRFIEKQDWWERPFPKGERPQPKLAEEKAPGGAAPAAAAASPPAARAQASPMRARLPEANAQATTTTGTTDSVAAVASIRLRPWQPDAPYATRMREAAADRVYRVYLDERPDYVRSSAFFLDAADILVEKGQSDLAVRVLSNLAEMDLENRHLLRILGYRLLQAGRPELAVIVFRKVLALAPEEPQSYRDLGLAYNATGEHQKAIDQLTEVVMRPWHGRFPDIELITLADLNAIAANGHGLDTSRLDPRLLRNLPLDLRVVLTWDADNTDIDLWVTDPNGEKAFYGHQLTYQGGRMSLDFTGGYGPEEFSLRSAKPGTYKIEANFFGHRQQTVAGATTLQVKLTTGFGTARAEEKIVTLRLKGQREVVYVGDFEVK